jgi:hypothetical protein
LLLPKCGAETCVSLCFLLSDSCLTDRARYLKHMLRRQLRLDGLLLTPSAAAAVVKFRAAWRPTPSPQTPPAMLPIVTGCRASVFIQGTFPHTLCFAQVDLQVRALRWSAQHFVSLHTVDQVSDSVEDDSVRCVYNGVGGISETLMLHVADTADWVTGLRTLLEMLPNSSSPAHWRWAQCCMKAASRQGVTGSILRSAVSFVLRRANASATLGMGAIDLAVCSAKESEQLLELPQCLRAEHMRSSRVLHAPQVVELLVQLSTSSSCITDLFNRSAPHGRMSFEEWLGFVRNEQLGSGMNLDVGDGEHEHHHVESMTTQDELDTAHRQFDRSGSAKLRVDRDLNLTQFAQLLLSPENDAVASGGTRSSGDLSVCQPLTHYWTACSHNSYIVGDQLTGLSSDDMYRRQLLQVCEAPLKSPLTPSHCVAGW